MTVDGIVFDMDGVLIHTEHVWDEVREQLTNEAGGRWRPGAQEAMMGLSSLEWSSRTRGDHRFDVAQTLARQIQVCQLVLLIAQGEYELPVGLLHARDHVDRALAEVSVRLVHTLSLNADLATVVVD